MKKKVVKWMKFISNSTTSGLNCSSEDTKVAGDGILINDECSSMQ